ncbi:hypothetical protein ACFWZ6_13925 [Streptomyces massasporeus]
MKSLSPVRTSVPLPRTVSVASAAAAGGAVTKDTTAARTPAAAAVVWVGLRT